MVVARIPASEYDLADDKCSGKLSVKRKSNCKSCQKREVRSQKKEFLDPCIVGSDFFVGG